MSWVVYIPITPATSQGFRIQRPAGHGEMSANSAHITPSKGTRYSEQHFALRPVGQFYLRCLIDGGTRINSVSVHRPWEVPYLPIDPKDIGRSYEPIIRVNSQSGKGGIAFLMESDYGVQLPRNLLIEFSQIVQQLSDSSGKEVTSPMLWETFRAEYLESRTEVACGLLNWIMEHLQDVSHTTGAVQIEMLVQMIGKCIGTSLRIVTQEPRHTVSKNKKETIVFLEMCVEEADHVFGVGMHEDPVRAGFNSVVSAIDRAARTQLLPSSKVSLDHDVSLSR